MDDTFLEKLAALVTIAAAAWFVLEQVNKGKACCASCAGGRKRGWGGGGSGNTACARSQFGSPPPRDLPVSTSDDAPSQDPGA